MSEDTLMEFEDSSCKCAYSISLKEFKLHFKMSICSKALKEPVFACEIQGHLKRVIKIDVSLFGKALPYVIMDAAAVRDSFESKSLTTGEFNEP